MDGASVPVVDCVNTLVFYKSNQGADKGNCAFNSIGLDGGLWRFCLTIGSTVVVLLAVFVLAAVTMVPRTICEMFVATDAGMVVMEVPLSDGCVARDVSVNGTTVGCCVPCEPIIWI